MMCSSALNAAVWLAFIATGCSVNDPVRSESSEENDGTMRASHVGIPEESAGPQGHPGKEFIAAFGVYVAIPAGHQNRLGTDERSIVANDGSYRIRVSWEPELQDVLNRLSEGIHLGKDLLQSAGQLEDLGQGRSGLITMLGEKGTHVIKEFRYNIFQGGFTKGHLACIAIITEEDDALFNIAKAKAMEVIASIEVVSDQELAAMWEHRLASVRDRKTTEGEARARQALTGKALVRVSSSSSSSYSGTASHTMVQRFQLCPDGAGLWTFSSNMNVNAEIMNSQGDVFDAGNLHSNTDDRVSGVWDVKHHRDGTLMIMIYSADGSEHSWFYQEGSDAGACSVGGKAFRVTGHGGSYGPDCR